MFTVKRFSPGETIISKEIETEKFGTIEAGFRAGNRVAWVVWDNEADRPSFGEGLNGKPAIDQFDAKWIAQKQADHLNGQA